MVKITKASKMIADTVSYLTELENSDCDVQYTRGHFDTGQWSVEYSHRTQIGLDHGVSVDSQNQTQRDASLQVELHSTTDQRILVADLPDSIDSTEVRAQLTDSSHAVVLSTNGNKIAHIDVEESITHIEETAIENNVLRVTLLTG
jgi:hypothetical protein